MSAGLHIVFLGVMFIYLQTQDFSSHVFGFFFGQFQQGFPLADPGRILGFGASGHLLVLVPLALRPGCRSELLGEIAHGPRRTADVKERFYRAHWDLPSGYVKIAIENHHL